MVLGMGKLGGGELNVSSDIDLVFLYPEEGETAGPRVVANREFFDRLGRRVIAMLDDATAAGSPPGQSPAQGHSGGHGGIRGRLLMGGEDG